MNSPASQAIQLVEAWHVALNQGDVKQLVNLVHPEVKIGGPRGTATGVEVLLQWVDRAKVNLIPQRYFQQNEVVVAEELGQWHSPESGEVTSTLPVATVFVIADGRIASIIRLDNLMAALQATGLDESQEVRPQ